MRVGYIRPSSASCLLGARKIQEKVERSIRKEWNGISADPTIALASDSDSNTSVF